MSHHELPHRRHHHADSLQRRHPDTIPRRRNTDPAPRRRKEDSKKGNTGFGAFVITVIAVMFLAYVFNFQGFATAADHFFSGLDAAGKSENTEVVSLTTALLPVLGLVIGALILVGIARWVLGGVKTSRKNRNLSNRQVITLEHFREITAARNIRPRIANHAYALLLPHYNRSMRVRLNDRLREELHMSDAQVADLRGNLLRNTDRKPRVGESTEIITVMDLLQCVQDAPRNFLHDTGGHAVAPAHRGSVIRPTLGRDMETAKPELKTNPGKP